MVELLLTETCQSIHVITLNNPKTLNALDSVILKELSEEIDKVKSDDSIKVVIITGSGKSFVAGADISAMSTMNSQEAKNFGCLGAQLFRKIEQLNKPVIAAVNGFALGGGCELAMSCDIRVASTKAKFGQPEVGLGITPGFSGTQRLPRLVGMGKAKELIYTGEIIGAEEAHRIGLVEKIVEPEQLMEVAQEMAAKIAANSKTAVAFSKESINLGLQTDIDSAIDIEVALFALCFSTKDQKEGMKAFIEKRKADFE